MPQPITQPSKTSVMKPGKKANTDQGESLSGVSISMETQLKQEVKRTMPTSANEAGQATISRSDMTNILSAPTTS